MCCGCRLGLHTGNSNSRNSTDYYVGRVEAEGNKTRMARRIKVKPHCRTVCAVYVAPSLLPLCRCPHTSRTIMVCRRPALAACFGQFASCLLRLTSYWSSLLTRLDARGGGEVCPSCLMTVSSLPHHRFRIMCMVLPFLFLSFLSLSHANLSSEGMYYIVCSIREGLPQQC